MKAERTVLVNPGRHPNFSTHPPLNLGYIASWLEKHGHEVRIVDELAGDNVEKELAEYQPDVVGVTATTPLVLDAYRVVKLAKGMGCYVVMGGVHVSSRPDEALEQGADAVVVGEGEVAFQRIVEGEEQAGVIEGPIVKNLDEIPPPAWHLMDMEFYVRARDRLPGTHLHFVPQHARVGALLTSRGCPYRCPFCYNSANPTPLRFHSAERVIEEMRMLHDEYRVDALMFMDDDLLEDEKRFSEICERWDGLDFVWGCQARSDTIVRAGMGILQRASELGCAQIVIGFESGSARILRYLKVGTTTLEDNEKAYDMCRRADIQPFGTFIVGSPRETVEDVRKTFEWIKAHPMPIGIFYFTPYPGTQAWAELEERGKVPQNPDWSRFTTDEPPFRVCDTIPEPTLRGMFNDISRHRDKFVSFSPSFTIREFIAKCKTALVRRLP